MQKLKKALKKLTNIRGSAASKDVAAKATAAKASGSKSAAKPALSAKKAPSTKKKSTPVAAKSAGAGAGKKAVAKKAAAPAKKAAPKAAPKAAKAAPKAENKDAKKKAVNGKAAAAPKSAKLPAKAEKPAKKALAPKKPAGKASEKPLEREDEKAAEKAPVKATQQEDVTVESATPAAITAEKPVRAARKAREEEVVSDTSPADEEVVLLDAEGRRYCRVKDCDQAAVVDGGYCRYHYLLFWKNIQSRKKILTEGKLERYIEELTARYPDKYLELLRKDLRSEKEFMAAIQELEIDEGGVDNEYEDEAQNYLDEVRGMGPESNAREEEDF